MWPTLLRPIDRVTGPLHMDTMAGMDETPQPSPPPYQPAPPFTPPRKKGLSTGATVAIVLCSIFGLFAIGCLALFLVGAADIASTPKPTYGVTACRWNTYTGTLSYSLTNNDKKAHNYWIEATMGHSPMIPATLKNVAPGETVTGEMVGGEQGDCRITRVDQT